MDFICPTCGESMPRDIEHVVFHTENHIVDVIKKDHPDWEEANGLCKKCYDHYKRQLHPDKYSK